jgi:hypothetical protein
MLIIKNKKMFDILKKYNYLLPENSNDENYQLFHDVNKIKDILASVIMEDNQIKYNEKRLNVPYANQVPYFTLNKLLISNDDIYSSKTNYDKACKKSKIPRETMFQHTLTFLNNTYGIKHLVIKHHLSILNSIKTFKKESNDVVVFGKILKNEIDEEFRFVQKHLKYTILELLKSYLKDQMRSKSLNDIESTYNLKINDKINSEE